MERLPNGQCLARFNLANGLRTFFIQNPKAPVLTAQIWYAVGSRDEFIDPDLRTTGLAHFFEHMMFRGTPDIPDGEFDRILTRAGGVDLNASTWFDRTNYYGSMPSDGLELILKMEADRMGNLVIDSNRLETERKAVLGEYNMGRDDPESEAIDHLYRKAFTTHPYGKPTIGTEEQIRGFTLEQTELFYRRYYAPNNATILLVGDFVPEKAKDLILSYFSGYEAQAIPKNHCPMESEQTGRRDFTFHHAQIAQTSLLMGFPIPAASHPDQAPLMVLQSMLTHGKSSWLEEAWVDSGDASTVDGSIDQFKDPGLFVLAADIHDRVQPEHLVDGLFKQINRIKRMGLPLEPHVERAKNQTLFHIYQQWEENSSLANYLGELLMATGDLQAGFKYASDISAVTSDEIRRVAGKYFSRDRLTTVVGRRGR